MWNHGLNFVVQALFNVPQEEASRSAFFAILRGTSIVAGMAAHMPVAPHIPSPIVVEPVAPSHGYKSIVEGGAKRSGI